MRITVSGVRLKCAMQALQDAGLALTVVRETGAGQIETVGVWTMPTDERVAGVETGIIRRGFGASPDDCEIVLDAARLKPETIGAVVAKLAASRT